MGSSSSESGRSCTFTCGICMEEKSRYAELFTKAGCCRSTQPLHNDFCTGCIGQHVAARIRQDPTEVRCPDLRCSSLLDPQNSSALADVLPEEVALRWEVAIMADMVRSMQQNSCPFQDCRAPLADLPVGRRKDRPVHCLECDRKVCGQCRVPWHWGTTCKNYMEKAKKEMEERKKRIDVNGDMKRATDVRYLDKKFKLLAKSRFWKRCPNCKAYVQKEMGCNHIHCRCRHEFCYACGRSWRWGHRCPLDIFLSTMREIRYFITDFLFSPCICCVRIN